MRIALCLHGLFNSTQDKTSFGLDGYNYIKKHILDKGNVDVFVHSWDSDKSELINALYKPKEAVYQQQINFNEIIKSRGLDTLENCPRPLHSVFSHLYSVTEVMKLPYKQLGIKYDIIIKARFDLGRINRGTSGPGLGNPHPVQCINFQTNIIDNKIYMANWNHFHMGPADMWFYGSSHIMSAFANLFSSFEDQMKLNSEFHKFATSIEGNSGDISNAIAFYKWWMIKNNLWDNRINLDTIWE